MAKDKIISLSVTFITAIAAISCLAWWMAKTPDVPLEMSVPGMDKDPSRVYKIPQEVVKIGEHFSMGKGSPADLPGYWSRFRGADFDNIVKNVPKLADTWGEKGPKVYWRLPLGEGHAAPVVRKGRLYLLDYDEKEKADALRCLSLADGREIWRRWYKVQVKRNHGMSRTVPALNDKYLVCIGPRCHVMCVDVETGDFKWGLDLVGDYGTKVPGWYTGQCPLLEGNTAIIAPAGREILLMGVDCETGKIIWQTPNPKQWKMSHSSVMPMTIAGKKMYVYSATGGMLGVSAEEADKGKVLWETIAWNHNVIAPSPMHLGNGKIYITAGYGAGSMLLQVVKNESGFAVKVLQEIKAKQGIASEQQTPILWQNRLFAILPKDAGPKRQQFICADPDDITKIYWSSGKTNRFGIGPFLLADHKFYILDDDGMLTMIRASIDGYEQLDQFRILDGHDAWGPIALAGTRMLLRDSKNMVCIEAGKKK